MATINYGRDYGRPGQPYYPGGPVRPGEVPAPVIDRTDPGPGNRPTDQPTSSPQFDTPFGPTVETDPNDPRHAGYVQHGETGGYLDDVGITIGAGRSTTPEDAERYYDEALAAGYSPGQVGSFLQQNPGDFERLMSALGPTWGEETSGGGGGGAGGGRGGSGDGVFTDPLTAQYEQLLQSQLSLYEQQRQDMEAQAQQAQARRSGTDAAYDRLQQFLTERSEKLQGPAYTGREADVLRTQLMDPLERDRDAAKQRALQQISMRGYELDSGVAQELLRQVDQAFDQYRARAGGEIATRQIEEERSREQEAQQLLQLLLQLPDAQARGDLDFLNYVQGLIAQPGVQSVPIGQMLANLPSERLHDALAALNLAPAGSATPGALNALAQLQANRFNQDRYTQGKYAGLGYLFDPSLWT